MSLSSIAYLRSLKYLYTTSSNGSTVFLTTVIQVNYQGHLIPHETAFDLIGWLFSVSGASPEGANRDNYYYPLVALYTMFCRRVSSTKKKEPQMVQITWFTQGTKTRVALGANLDKPAPVTKTAARVRRRDQMVNLTLITIAEQDTSFVGDPNGSQGQLFGHCAETFPFIYIKR